MCQNSRINWINCMEVPANPVTLALLAVLLSPNLIILDLFPQVAIHQLTVPASPVILALTGSPTRTESGNIGSVSTPSDTATDSIKPVR